MSRRQKFWFRKKRCMPERERLGLASATKIKKDIYHEVYEKVDIESLKSILGELTGQ